MIKLIAQKFLTVAFALVMASLILGIFGGLGAFVSTLIEGPSAPAHLSLPVAVGLVIGVLTCVALAIELDWLNLFSDRKDS